MFALNCKQSGKQQGSCHRHLLVKVANSLNIPLNSCPCILLWPAGRWGKNVLFPPIHQQEVQTEWVWASPDGYCGNGRSWPLRFTQALQQTQATQTVELEHGWEWLKRSRLTHKPIRSTGEELRGTQVNKPALCLPAPLRQARTDFLASLSWKTICLALALWSVLSGALRDLNTQHRPREYTACLGKLTVATERDKICSGTTGLVVCSSCSSCTAAADGRLKGPSLLALPPLLRHPLSIPTSRVHRDRFHLCSRRHRPSGLTALPFLCSEVSELPWLALLVWPVHLYSS